MTVWSHYSFLALLVITLPHLTEAYVNSEKRAVVRCLSEISALSGRERLANYEGVGGKAVAVAVCKAAIVTPNLAQVTGAHHVVEDKTRLTVEAGIWYKGRDADRHSVAVI